MQNTSLHYSTRSRRNNDGTVKNCRDVFQVTFHYGIALVSPYTHLALFIVFGLVLIIHAVLVPRHILADLMSV